MHKCTSFPACASLCVALAAAGCGPCNTDPLLRLRPDVVVDPVEVQFGDVLVGLRVSRSVTLGNTGESTLYICTAENAECDAPSPPVSSAGAFALELPTGLSSALSIPAGQQTVVEASFSPSSEGEETATLTIATNVEGKELVEIRLAGRATTAPPPPPSCTVGYRQPCYTGAPGTRLVGGCHDGVQTCIADGDGIAAWSECENEVLPSAELCGDGNDDDCDGSVDETCPCVDGATGACATHIDEVGQCRPGEQICEDGAWSECRGAIEPVDELCGNYVDDDCNGSVDEICECQEGDTVPCDEDFPNVGACHPGTRICVDGAFGECVGSVGPRDEVCTNAVDDDCDGAIDGDDESCAPDLVAVARFPWNGWFSGSVWAESSGAHTPLRPRFRWEVSPLATRYELQADDDCDVGTFRSCAFPSPELVVSVSATEYLTDVDLPVSTVAPVGRRYYWRVRACNDATCSPWTEPRYLNVGRLRDDYDGDGYSDVVVGSFGSVSIYPGSATGVVDAPVVLSSTKNSYGREVTAIGDINADGFADLALFSEFSFTSTTDIYLGPIVSLRPPDMQVAPSSYLAGVFLDGGDVDADGYDDLLVGALDPLSFVYRGSAAGLVNAAVPLVVPPEVNSCGFGCIGEMVIPHAIGDINGDGTIDVLIGARLPQSDPDALDGVAYLFLSDQSGSLSALVQRIAAPVLARGGQFGSSVEDGDLNGDGFSDVVIAAPATPPTTVNHGTGIVFGYLGGRAGLPSQPDLTIENPRPGETGAFGTSMSIADFDDDGAFDVFVGGAGLHVVFGYSGSANGPVTTPTVVLDHPLGVDHPLAYAWGTTAVSSGDVNGDGSFELLWGARYVQRAYVSYWASGLVTSTPVVLEATHSTVDFGFSID